MIDPVLEQVRRDLQLLKDLGLELSHILETHVHADHVTAGVWSLEDRGVSGRVPPEARRFR